MRDYASPMGSLPTLTAKQLAQQCTSAYRRTDDELNADVDSGEPMQVAGGITLTGWAGGSSTAS